MYHYGGNNPVRYVDPDGNAIHILIGAGIGAAVGLGNQVINDVFSGNLSSISDYVGSMAGGAATGAVLAATGNGALAGAAGGLAQNIAKTTVDVGAKLISGDNVDVKETAVNFVIDTVKDVAVGATVGKLCSIPKGIPGINSGKGSMKAVAKSAMTKLGNGTITNISAKTSGKIAVSRCAEGALVSGTGLADLINLASDPKVDEMKHSVNSMVSE